MISLLDVESEFDKIKYIIMIKIFSIVEIVGSFFNLIKFFISYSFYR